MMKMSVFFKEKIKGHKKYLWRPTRFINMNIHCDETTAAFEMVEFTTTQCQGALFDRAVSWDQKYQDHSSLASLEHDPKESAEKFLSHLDRDLLSSVSRKHNNMKWSLFAIIMCISTTIYTIIPYFSVVAHDSFGFTPTMISAVYVGYPLGYVMSTITFNIFGLFSPTSEEGKKTEQSDDFHLRIIKKFTLACCALLLFFGMSPFLVVASINNHQRSHDSVQSAPHLDPSDFSLRGSFYKLMSPKATVPSSHADAFTSVSPTSLYSVTLCLVFFSVRFTLGVCIALVDCSLLVLLSRHYSSSISQSIAEWEVCSSAGMLVGPPFGGFLFSLLTPSYADSKDSMLNKRQSPSGFSSKMMQYRNINHSDMRRSQQHRCGLLGRCRQLRSHKSNKTNKPLRVIDDGKSSSSAMRTRINVLPNPNIPKPPWKPQHTGEDVFSATGNALIPAPPSGFWVPPTVASFVTVLVILSLYHFIIPNASFQRPEKIKCPININANGTNKTHQNRTETNIRRYDKNAFSNLKQLLWGRPIVMVAFPYILLALANATFAFAEAFAALYFKQQQESSPYGFLGLGKMDSRKMGFILAIGTVLYMGSYLLVGRLCDGGGKGQDSQLRLACQIRPILLCGGAVVTAISIFGMCTCNMEMGVDFSTSSLRSLFDVFFSTHRSYTGNGDAEVQKTLASIIISSDPMRADRHLLLRIVTIISFLVLHVAFATCNVSALSIIMAASSKKCIEGDLAEETKQPPENFVCFDPSETNLVDHRDDDTLVVTAGSVSSAVVQIGVITGPILGAYLVADTTKGGFSFAFFVFSGVMVVATLAYISALVISAAQNGCTSDFFYKLLMKLRRK